MFYHSFDQKTDETSAEENVPDIENPSTQADNQEAPIDNSASCRAWYKYIHNNVLVSSYFGLSSISCACTILMIEPESEETSLQLKAAFILGAIGSGLSLATRQSEDDNDLCHRYLANAQLLVQELALYFTLSSPEYDPDNIRSQMSSWCNIASQLTSASSVACDIVTRAVSNLRIF